MNALTGAGPSSSSSNSFSPISISDCVAFWDFNDLSSLDVNMGDDSINSAADKSLSGHTLTGGTGKPVSTVGGGFNNGNYAAFDGSTSYMNTADFAYAPSSAFSVVARVKGASQQLAMIAAYTAPIDPYFYMSTGFLSSDKLRVLVSDGGPDTTVFETTTEAFDDTWKCVGFTVDSTALKAFIDGIKTDEDVTSFPFGSTNGIQVGARDSGTPDRFFNGCIQWIAVYSRVLTETEMAQLNAYDF